MIYIGALDEVTIVFIFIWLLVTTFGSGSKSPTCIFTFTLAGMLPLRDLADKIALKLQECLFAGLELYGRKENNVFLCRIIKTLHDSAGKKQYKIAWLDKDKEVVGYDLIDDEDLTNRKLPFSRNMVKSFIRESTYRNAPWVLHPRLAEKHGVSTHLPDELKSKFYFQNGTLISYKKNRKNGVEEMVII